MNKVENELEYIRRKVYKTLLERKVDKVLGENEWKMQRGILLVIYLFFLVPLLAGAFIDAKKSVKRRNISATYANGFVAMLGIFWGVAVLFYIVAVH